MAAPLAAQVSYQNVTIQRNDDKLLYALRMSGMKVREKVRNLFKEILEQDVLVLPKINCLD